MQEINKTSGYWLGTDLEDRYYNPLTGLSNKPSGRDLFALSGYKKAISNFVRIVTGDNIPVEFQGDDSYTDGKSVNLSSNIKSGNFDVAVGLALHEGSHIKLTDFRHLKEGIRKFIPSELTDAARVKSVSERVLGDLVKNLLNVVEDRRIDNYIVTTAQGYKGYYEAMYDYYFNDKMIDKALRTQQWGDKTIESYMNHVINFINPNRTLDILPGLKDLWIALNLRNISRLQSTDDALEVALKMAAIVIDNITPLVLPEEENDKEDEERRMGQFQTSEALTLKDKIVNKIAKLGKALEKLDDSDPRVPKVIAQTTYYTELFKNC